MLIIQKPNDVNDVKHFTSCEIVNKFIVYSCEKHRVINNYILHVCLLLHNLGSKTLQQICSSGWGDYWDCNFVVYYILYNKLKTHILYILSQCI